MKFYLSLFLLVFCGCTQIQISDDTFYADKGPLGAVEIHTLTAGTTDISPAQWNNLRFGMICTDENTFAKWKADIETLCSYTSECDYPAVSAFLDRVTSKR